MGCLAHYRVTAVRSDALSVAGMPTDTAGNREVNAQATRLAVRGSELSRSPGDSPAFPPVVKQCESRIVGRHQECRAGHFSLLFIVTEKESEIANPLDA